MTKTIAILVARLIFGGAFLMATTFKFAGMEATAQYIASLGFPFPLFFAWVAALFELGLALALFTGAFFSEAAALAAVGVEQRGEHAGRVEPARAEPVDGAVGADERRGAQVADDPVLGDREVALAARGAHSGTRQPRGPGRSSASCGPQDPSG